MYVKNIKAEPNFCGGQIDLFWKNPSRDEFPGFRGVKIVRRERRFPEDLTDGKLIYPVHEEEEYWDKDRSFSDKDLKGETVYYYTFYTCGNNGSNPDAQGIGHFTSRACRVAAMATSDYAMGEGLYQLIPAIYKRYDTVYSPPKIGASSEDEKKGELQRFLEIFGCQLDLIRSFVAGTEKFFDMDECHGALLPLLAQWIGWEPNISFDYDSQRNEIRYAPEIYKTVGIVANLRAFINRLTGWDCRIKEFVHNVFMSNDPERLNIWSQRLTDAQRLTDENWSNPEMLSLDYAYDGAASSFVDHNGRIWMFYHAEREIQNPVKHGSRSGKKRIAQWDIYFKIFDNGEWSPGHQVTRGLAIDKYPSAFQAGTGNIWLFWSSYNEGTWNIRTKIMAVGREAISARLFGQMRSEPFPLENDSTLVISIDGERNSAVRFKMEDFASVDVVNGIANATCAEVTAVINRDLPNITASTEEGNKICLISNTTGEGSSIIIDVDASTAAAALGFGSAFPNASNNNTEPSAFEEDGSGHIWLFWSSRRQGVRDIWYNKFDGTSWGVEKRLTSGIYPDRESAAIFFDAPDPNTNTQRKIWVFWSRKELPLLFELAQVELAQGFQRDLDNATITEGLKQEFESNSIFLSEFARILIKKTGSRWLITDKINYLIQKKENKLYVYGPERWNIFYTTKPNAEWNESVWHEEKVLLEIPCGQSYDNREPAVIRMDNQGKIRVFWSSNQTGSWNIWYKTFNKSSNQWSEEKQATEGHYTKKAPTAVDDDQGNIRLFFRSNQSITYTSKIYPNTMTIDSRYSGSTAIDMKNRERIDKRTRIDDILHYTYDTDIDDVDWYARDTVGIYLIPETSDQYKIAREKELIKGLLDRFLPVHLRAVIIIPPVGEPVYTYDFPYMDPQRVIGERFFDSTIPETYPPLKESYEDKVPGWIWFRSWSEEYPDHYTVDFSTSPIELKFRTWHIGIETGG